MLAETTITVSDLELVRTAQIWMITFCRSF